MKDPEFDNTRANVDFIFRSIDNLVVRTNHVTGEEEVAFSHKGSGFVSKVMFYPLAEDGLNYKTMLTAHLEGRGYFSSEEVRLNPEERLAYAWMIMQEGFARLHIPDND